ncbi:hypothetical protein Fmac_005735 [Flemingia macrophylla]|uniref:Folate gamma-glutamyl hydrolase n=1 Tax=Flemingia macrophylla TaxID=520843 RepID=A0ABD1NBD9_9FABA
MVSSLISHLAEYRGCPDGQDAGALTPNPIGPSTLINMRMIIRMEDSYTKNVGATKEELLGVDPAFQAPPSFQKQTAPPDICASVQAIKTDSYKETRDLISYWILLSLIYLFEYAFSMLRLCVAVETNLKEWTARTKVYDRCHEPALLHASVARNRKLIVDWVPAGDLEDVTYKEGAHGVLVPGGFRDRGVQGKILAAKYAR